jgi:hypothetical protein
MVDTLAAHLATLRSPFSTAVGACKVPDGRASSSIASREACAGVAIADADTNALLFCLTPCLLGSFSCIKLKNGSAAQPNATPPVAAVSGVVEYLSPGNDITLASAANGPDKYRMCSVGMRLSAINAAQFNNGWFEAIRVPTDYSQTEFRLDNTTGVAVPLETFENKLIENQKWCNHPSYVTGKIPELHKHQFYLQPTSDRDFQRWTTSPIFMDTNFDMILVRVYANKGAVPSLSIHYHAVAHHEYQYDSGSEKARYHSQCISAPNAVVRVDAPLKKDPKASIIRSGNAYSYNYR